MQRAYASCLQLARDHYENFPVASILVPARMRPHVAAIYAFARTADDFADEPGRSPAERLELLDDWQQRLEAVAAGKRAAPDDHVFLALAETIERCDLPGALFLDLLSAFRQDVSVHRYETWDALFEYCRRSANPVGRLVLRVAGVADASADAASDAVCTALQLANFWQDVGRDWQNGRLYVPAEELARAGASERDLDSPPMTPQWRAAMRACVDRTRDLFVRGRPVADLVHGRLRWEIRATWLGGMRILDRIEAQDYDTLLQRPTLSLGDAPTLAAGLIRWRSSTSVQLRD